MKNKNALALLLAPIVFFALLIFTADSGVQAAPHRDRYYRGGDYSRSVAVVWALDSIKDGVSCHDSLRKYTNEVRGASYDREYERDYRYFGGDTSDAISVTYEELAGACTDHDPHAGAREQAAYFLAGMKVSR